MSKEIDINSEIKTIKKLENDYSKIASHLLSLQVELPYESDQLKDLIAELHNSTDGFDFLVCCKDVLINGSDVFRIADLLKKTILKFKNINVVILADLLELFANKMKGDMTAGLFHSAIEDLSEIREGFSLELENEILQRKKDNILGYLIASYTGLSKQDFNSGFNKLTNLINENTKETYIANGLRGIGCLRDRATENKGKISEILKKMNRSEVVFIVSNSAFATCNLLQFINTLKDEVELLSKSNIPEIQYELSAHLRMADNCSEEWKKECLLNLISNTRSINKGITDNIDSVFYSALKNNNDFVFVKKMLVHWIETRTDEEMITRKLDNIFPMSFTILVTDKEFISQLVTEWFNNDEMKFHKANTHLVDYMKLHKVKPTFLDKEYLSCLDFDSSLFVIRKILGYIFEFNYSATYLLTFLKIDKDNEKLFNLVASVFIEHVGYNYPVKTIEFLESLNDSEFNKLAHKYIAVISKELIKRKEVLEDLKPINEIRPELDMLWKIENQRQKAINKAMENAQEGSIARLFTNVSIKEGKSWFSYMHGKYSDVSKMAHISESIELPKNDVLDEIGASMERQGFRIAKRGQK